MIKPKDIKTEFLHPEKRDAIQQPNNHLDNYTFVQDEFQELMNEFVFIKPHWLMPMARCFYSTETDELRLLAGVGKTELFIENLKIAIAEADAKKKLKPKTKKKANYKNKAYKNTAKQTKPSPILMSLIKKV